MAKFSKFISFLVKNSSRTESEWMIYDRTDSKTGDTMLYLSIYFTENKCGVFSPTVFKSLKKLRQIDFDDTQIYVRVPKVIMKAKGGLLEDIGGLSYGRVIKAKRVGHDMSITLVLKEVDESFLGKMDAYADDMITDTITNRCAEIHLDGNRFR